jgi:hypothetical protein
MFLRLTRSSRGAVAAVLVVAAASSAAGAAPAAAAAPAREAPRVLATGDSMLMYTDRVLRARLHASARARVISDIRVATGLAKPWLLHWDAHAAWQARRHRPDVVLATMGANDIHPIGRSPCCSARWAAAYAGRIGRLARVWRRGGARRVYWLTLPIQAHARLEPLFTAVNRAVERAPDVRVIDVRPIVNPGGAYHHELEVAPGDVRQIRFEDGVHLWWPGAELVADAVIARLEADGVIPRVAPRRE